MLFSRIIQQIYNIDALTTVLVAVFTLSCLTLSNLWLAHRPTLILQSTTLLKCVLFVKCKSHYAIYPNYVYYFYLLYYYYLYIITIVYVCFILAVDSRTELYELFSFFAYFCSTIQKPNNYVVVASERVGTIYNQLQNLYNTMPYILYIYIRITAHCWRGFSPFIFFQSHLTHTVEMRYIQCMLYIKVSRKICLWDI